MKNFQDYRDLPFQFEKIIVLINTLSLTILKTVISRPIFVHVNFSAFLFQIQKKTIQFLVILDITKNSSKLLLARKKNSSKRKAITIKATNINLYANIVVTERLL